MRIIGGTHKGRVISPPKGLELRPTTDFAKEGLFNILSSRLDFENLEVLDLFAGTGNISLEFASRGSKVTAVEMNGRCCGYIRETSLKWGLNVNIIKQDVFRFLGSAGKTFDLIFADPPYEHSHLLTIPELILHNNLLKNPGILIVEHGSKTAFNDKIGFTELRRYGNVNFSFFSNEKNLPESGR